MNPWPAISTPKTQSARQINELGYQKLNEKARAFMKLEEARIMIAKDKPSSSLSSNSLPHYADPNKVSAQIFVSNLKAKLAVSIAESDLATESDEVGHSLLYFTKRSVRNQLLI